MKLLVISTALDQSFIALIKENKVAYQNLSHLTTSENLLPQIDKILKKYKVKKEELDAISICVGPGSFTGIRVGVATAKAFNVALSTPLIAFNVFDLFSEKLPCLTKANSGGAYARVNGEIIFLQKEELGKLIGKKVQIFSVEENYFSDFSKKESVDFIYETINISLKNFEEKKFLNAKDIIPLYVQKSQAEKELDLSLKSASVQPSKPNDAPAIFEIEKECFKKYYSLETIENEIKNQSKKLFVLKIKNQIVGYVLYSLLGDEIEIERICVIKRYRGLGLAKKLLDETLNSFNAKKCFLEVNKKNSIAIKLYRSFGFKETGERKGYYENGEDAVLMTKIF